ncbi:50S ribosomal protein L15 [soil metagenome]
MAELHELRRPPGSHRDRKRLGRGPGSGTGKTSGKGHKGSKARAGHSGPGGGKPHFEGGQLPLQRRLPKRGFTPLERTVFQVVNVRDLDRLEIERFDPPSLAQAGLIARSDRPVKVLGTGEMTRKVTVAAHAFSRTARAKIEGQGGSVEEIG